MVLILTLTNTQFRLLYMYLIFCAGTCTYMYYSHTIKWDISDTTSHRSWVVPSVSMSIFRSLFRLAKIQRGKFFLLFLLVLFLSLLGFLLTSSFSSTNHRHGNKKTNRQSLTVIPDNEYESHLQSKTSCLFHTCFEINNCPFGVKDQIKVYVYPEIEFTDEETNQRYSPSVSLEYKELLSAVKGSPYYEENDSRACVFVTALDTLNQDKVNVGLVSAMLRSLPQWVLGDWEGVWLMSVH